MKQQNILLLGDQKDTHCIYQAAQEINTCLMTTTQCDNIIDKIDEYDIKLFLISEKYIDRQFLKKLRISFPRGRLSIVVITYNACIVNASNLISNEIDDCLYAQDFFLRLRLSKILSDIEFIAQSIAKSQIDYLTNMYNRMSFHDLATKLCEISKYENTNLCCAIIDIDHFKKINDTYGHLTGDEVIISVSSLIKSHFRKNDLVGRYGGEEFIVLMHDISVNKANELFENLRKEIEDLHIYTNELDLNITVSIGLYSGYNYDLLNLQSRADELLYKAKESGRNRLVFQ